MDHLLFLLCLFRKEERQNCQARCFILRGEYCWHDELEWLKVHYVNNDFQRQIKRLSLSIAVYHIWKARNVVCYQNRRKISHDIIKYIFEDIRNATEIWNLNLRGKNFVYKTLLVVSYVKLNNFHVAFGFSFIRRQVITGFICKIFS